MLVRCVLSMIFIKQLEGAMQSQGPKFLSNAEHNWLEQMIPVQT